MKAKITNEQFDMFIAFMSNAEKAKNMYDTYEKNFYGRWSEKQVKALNKCLLKFINGRQGSVFGKYYELRAWAGKNEYDKLRDVVAYAEKKDLGWHVEVHISPYLVLSFSDKSMFILEDFCTLIEEPDYKSMTVQEIQACIGGEHVMKTLPVLSIADMEEEKSKLDIKQEKLKKAEEDLKWLRNTELAKMQEEIREMERKMRKRKEELMAELHEKMAELEKQKSEMEKQIYMLESQIYIIRCYEGETVELSMVLNGKPASLETPIVLNQKLLYLDEDLARLAGVYQYEVNTKRQLFEDVLKVRPDVVDAFCPQERCITFFRISRNTRYVYRDHESGMYEYEDLIHGSRIGFLFRNGEQLYIGWMGESWSKDARGEDRKVTFQDSLMYRPGVRIDSTSENMEDGAKSDSQNTMLSRMFAMSVLQGIVDNEKLIQFPEKVNIMAPNPYVVFNYADGWIADNRFGDFNSLVNFLNQFTKEKDVILLFTGISHSDTRSNGEANRTHDCKLKNGVHVLNLVKNGEAYVSAEKEYSHYGATANVRVYEDEFINITYMNSIWLNYYVQTKKLGNYGKDYARMLQHFRNALKIIQKREEKELNYIIKHYPEVESIVDWQLYVSHWKIKNQIRVVTDFQAKRIAAYLKTRQYFQMKHMFEPVIQYKESLKDFVPRNLYGDKDCASCFTNGQGKFCYDSKYGKNRSLFWMDKSSFDTKKTELLAMLSEEEALDTEKLQEIRKRVSEFLKENNIDTNMLYKYLKLEKDKKEFVKGAIDFSNTELLFRAKDTMLPELEYAVRHGLWNEVYSFQLEYTCDTDFWYLYYLNGLQKVYQTLLYTAMEIATNNWLLEIEYFA